MSTKKAKGGKSIVPAPKPSEKALAAAQVAREQRDAMPYRPTMKLTRSGDGGPVSIGALNGDNEGLHALLASALGSCSADFINSAVAQIVNVAQVNEVSTNAAIAIIAAIQPRDEYEASLAVQIATTHLASQNLLSLTLNRSTVQGMAAYGNLATKFQRTELAARDALTRHRCGGVQTVKHVHVNEGGQAIVADSVSYGGGIGK